MPFYTAWKHWGLGITRSLHVPVSETHRHMHMRTRTYTHSHTDADTNTHTHALIWFIVHEATCAFVHAFQHTHALSLWLLRVAVATVGWGTRALVGGYSQHLYGAINQSQGTICAPEKKKGWWTEEDSREKKRVGVGFFVSPKHYIITSVYYQVGLYCISPTPRPLSTPHCFALLK